MNLENLKSSIIGELPQIPFILDQVGEAIEWAEESYDDAKLVRVLSITANVAKWVSSISEPNFYRTYLVVASILSDIPDVLNNPRFEKFKSTSGAIEDTIKDITVDSEAMDTRGCFSALTIHLAQLAQRNENSLALMLYGILYDLEEVVAGIKEAGEKTPITPQDYITILGYAFVMANIRMSNLSLLEYNTMLINRIEIILNEEVKY